MKIKTNERIRELMDELGINSVVLGKAIGLSSQSLNNFLRTNNPIRYDNLLKLAEYFSCSVNFICGRTDISGQFKKHKKYLFPYILKKMITNSKKTIELMAKEMGISRSSFYDWLDGSLPTSASLIILADYFDCTIDFLIGMEN